MTLFHVLGYGSGAFTTKQKVLAPLTHLGTTRTAPASLDPSHQENPTFPGIKDYSSLEKPWRLRQVFWLTDHTILV